MSRRRIAVVLVGIVTAVGIGAASFAADDQAKMKSMMGDNFAAMQAILVALVTSQYTAVPSQIDLIHQHAVELVKMAPEGSEADRKKFMVYAYGLEGNAADVKSIVELLIEHDKNTKSGEALQNDHLREALAAHYSGMVTMCVACHNEFRPRVVE